MSSSHLSSLLLISIVFKEGLLHPYISLRYTYLSFKKILVTVFPLIFIPKLLNIISSRKRLYILRYSIVHDVKILMKIT